MLRDRLSLEALDDLDDIYCGICHQLTRGSHIAAWLRLRPRDDFDPVCVECAYTIMHSALSDLDRKAALEESVEM